MDFTLFIIASAIWIALLLAIRTLLRRIGREVRVDDIEKYVVFGVLGIAAIAALLSL